MNNNKEIMEAVNVLAEQIASALKYTYSSYDKTFISVIQSVHENGTYSIIDEFGSERICVFSIPNITLEVGQRVYVTIPQNDLKKMYISGIHPQITNR